MSVTIASRYCPKNLLYVLEGIQISLRHDKSKS